MMPPRMVPRVNRTRWPSLEMSFNRRVPGEENTGRSRPESVTAYKAELPPFPFREPVNQTSSPRADHANPFSDFHPDDSVVLSPLRFTSETDPPLSPSRS